MQQCLRDRIEQITSYLKTAGYFCLREAERFSHQRLDTYDQFLHAERLFQIIVCPKLEPLHYIVDAERQSETVQVSACPSAGCGVPFEAVHLGIIRHRPPARPAEVQRKDAILHSPSEAVMDGKPFSSRRIL